MDLTGTAAWEFMTHIGFFVLQISDVDEKHSLL